MTEYEDYTERDSPRPDASRAHVTADPTSDFDFLVLLPSSTPSAPSTLAALLIESILSRTALLSTPLSSVYLNFNLPFPADPDSLLAQSPLLSRLSPSSFMHPELTAESHRHNLLSFSPRNPPNTCQNARDCCDDHRVSEPLPHGGVQDPADVVAVASAEDQVHASLNPLDSGLIAQDGMTESRSPPKHPDAALRLTALTSQPQVSLQTLPNGMSSSIHCLSRTNSIS